jgi:hypothetical protein
MKRPKIIETGCTRLDKGLIQNPIIVEPAIGQALSRKIGCHDSGV